MMREFQMIVRIRSADGFNAARTDLRTSITSSLTAWPLDLELVSLSPIPRDRVVKPRRPPTKRSFPLLDFINKGN